MSQISLTEAARRLGVTPARVTQLVERGVFLAQPDPTDGRRRLVDEAAVGELAELRQAQATLDRLMRPLYANAE